MQLRIPHFGRLALKENLPRTLFLRLLESCGMLAIQRRNPVLTLHCIEVVPRALFHLMVLRRLLVHIIIPWKDVYT